MHVDQLLTPLESARRLGISLNLFLYHVGKGAVRPVPVGAGKHPFFEPAELDRWGRERSRR